MNPLAHRPLVHGLRSTRQARARTAASPWPGPFRHSRYGYRPTERGRAVRRLGRPGEGSCIRELARIRGIQLAYRDMAGQRREASPSTLKALLSLWGMSTDSPGALRESLREQKQRAARRPLPLVQVAWNGEVGVLCIRPGPELDLKRVYCRLLFEDGSCKSLNPLSPASQGGALLCLPKLPFGYHQLELECRHRVEKCLLISAPERSYSPPGALRDWGLFLPMYAAHSQQSWGAGNISDWEALAVWTGSLGGRVMATLPLLAAFLGQPFSEPSPYSPVSRLFWNEFYLDIEKVPEFTTCPAAQKLCRSAAFQRRLGDFRKEPLIEYEGQMALRRVVLEAMAQSFFAAASGSRRERFEQFKRTRPELMDYACFRAACEHSQSSWRKWEPRMRYGKLQPGDFREDASKYHAYVQWLAEEQVSGMVERCRSRGIQPCLDLPVGVHADGYDLWREHDQFAFPVRVGAPPDPYFPNGQDWGFAPLHPERMRERRYEYVLKFLRFQMRHCGLLRVDHIMGLHRLYWIPPGFAADQGAYVSYPAEELYALLSLESHRNKTLLLGENLGTVPPEVNQAMERHGLRQTYVLQYEQRPNSRQALRRPPARSLASMNTHDMPTFAAHCAGADIEHRARLGVLPGRNLGKEHDERSRAIAALRQFLKRGGWLQRERADCGALLRACLAWLAESDAETILVSLEDLWLEQEPQNVPGTSAERPNWRRKTRFTVEEIQAAEGVSHLLRELASRRSKARRRGLFSSGQSPKTDRGAGYPDRPRRFA